MKHQKVPLIGNYIWIFAIVFFLLLLIANIISIKTRINLIHGSMAIINYLVCLIVASMVTSTAFIKKARRPFNIDEYRIIVIGSAISILIMLIWAEVISGEQLYKKINAVALNHNVSGFILMLSVGIIFMGLNALILAILYSPKLIKIYARKLIRDADGIINQDIPTDK